MKSTIKPRVPLLDLTPQLDRVGDQLKQAVCEVIDSGCYILGPRVVELERQVAAYVGSEFAVGVSSGTDALLMALMALGVESGDVVLTTPYSFFATAGAIVRVGARPAFVDIDPCSFNMDPAALGQWLADHPADIHRVKAAIPVHLFGQCADLDPIGAHLRPYQIAVIEDAAQSLGAQYPSTGGIRTAGAMGRMGCYSFFPSKNLGALGDGGMIVTCDAQLAETLACLRNHGARPKYYHQAVGGNFRLDAIQAAALLVKLPYLNDWHEERRRNADYYDRHLKHDAISTPVAVYGQENHVYNQYVLRADRRDELRAFLRTAGIETEVYYPLPLHRQECFRALGYSAGDFPHSEDAARTSLALPIYPGLTRAMQNYIIEMIGEFYG